MLVLSGSFQMRGNCSDEIEQYAEIEDRLTNRLYPVTVSRYPGGGVLEVCQHVNNGMNKSTCK